MNIFTFDIETIPDTASGRRLYDLADTLSDAEVAEVMFEKRREKTGNDFLPLHLHRIVAISAVLKTSNNVNIWSLGDIDASEADIIQRFFTGIEKFSPVLVSWNGSGFDLPVIHYRALLHGVAAPRYWETGEEDTSFKWNNYLNRYHMRHTDIMDVLACYQARAFAPLDDIAVMLGLPGKMGMSGGKVWESFLAGDVAGIRNYCETDVLNTHLVYLQFQRIQGKISEKEHTDQCQELRDFLSHSDQAHFHEFLQQWENTK